MVEHTPDVLILEVVRRRTPLGERRHRGAGYREYLPGLEILPCVRPGEAKILSVTGEQGPRDSPVAGLARDGLTNREIDSSLLVSPHRAGPVPHILRKTGLVSRSRSPASPRRSSVSSGCLTGQTPGGSPHEIPHPHP